ncbi:MAG: PhoH family protein [Pseudomonadota bacterium]
MTKRSRSRRELNEANHRKGKRTTDNTRRTPRNYDDEFALPTESINAIRRNPQPFKPSTPAQHRYVSAIKNHCLTFGVGPAGTGKSYCAAALAAEALESGEADRIILTRPAVEAGERLGFLPGELEDKFAVYIEAFRDALNDRLGSGAVDYYLRYGRIVAAPLAFMRGKTFARNTFVILDEAQNTSVAQMKMFLTRIGTDARVVVNGDVAQSDIGAANGLADALRRVRNLPGVYVHEFERSDIVRSGLVRALLDRYEEPRCQSEELVDRLGCRSSKLRFSIEPDPVRHPIHPHSQDVSVTRVG